MKSLCISGRVLTTTRCLDGCCCLFVCFFVFYDHVSSMIICDRVSCILSPRVAVDMCQDELSSRRPTLQYVETSWQHQVTLNQANTLLESNLDSCLLPWAE